MSQTQILSKAGTSKANSSEALMLIHSLSQMRTQAQVLNAWQTECAAYGYQFGAICDIAAPNGHHEHQIMYTQAPAEFITLYHQRDFAAHDPVLRQCLKGPSAVIWSEASVDRYEEPAAQEVMDRAADFGLKYGLSFVCHGTNGMITGVLMSASHTPEISAQSKPTLHMIGLYTLERLRALPGYTSLAIPNLTQREQEVLKWCALGKSAAAIAEKIGISENTVVFHTMNAIRKLEARNKTQAVAKAIAARLIHL